jgi:hypothetical protein
MTNYIKFRYDLKESEHPISILYRIWKQDFPVGILGIETKNKYGEEIKRHFHYHFMTDEKIETIRRRFTRSSVKDEKDNYSMALEKDVIDENKFFRYPMKQYELEYKPLANIKVPENFDLNMQRILANEEWEKGKQILSRQRVKHDSRQTTYEKILSIIEENCVRFSNLKEIRIYILDYYLENDIPPNRMKIIDMSDGIAIKQGIIGKEEYFR